MRIPISETDLGGWYEFRDSAIFYPVNSSYYDNCMLNKGNYKISTFNVFKEVYPIQIGNGWYRKRKRYEK